RCRGRRSVPLVASLLLRFRSPLLCRFALARPCFAASLPLALALPLRFRSPLLCRFASARPCFAASLPLALALLLRFRSPLLCRFALARPYLRFASARPCFAASLPLALGPGPDFTRLSPARGYTPDAIRRSAASTVFFISMAMVSSPTPPGTGV